MNSYLKENYLKYRDIYYTFRDHLILFYKDENNRFEMKHIVYIFNDLVSNIPYLIEKNNYLILKEKDFILNNLLDDLKLYLDNTFTIFTIKNFKLFCYKLYVIKKAFELEDKIIEFVEKYKYYIPYYHIDFYNNKEFMEYLDNWCINIKKILPSNFSIIKYNTIFEIDKFTNFIYSFNLIEFRQGILSILEFFIFIYNFKSYLIINKNIKN